MCRTTRERTAPVPKTILASRVRAPSRERPRRANLAVLCDPRRMRLSEIRGSGGGAVPVVEPDGDARVDALRAWLDRPLAERPVVVVLDHPTASLDTAQVAVVRDLIVELAAGGTAVLLASDDLDELLVLTSRVYTLAAGRVTGELQTRVATPAGLLAKMMG